jgi:hypothetical protein
MTLQKLMNSLSALVLGVGNGLLVGLIAEEVRVTYTNYDKTKTGVRPAIFAIPILPRPAPPARRAILMTGRLLVTMQSPVGFTRSRLTTGKGVRW